MTETGATTGATFRPNWCQKPLVPVPPPLYPPADPGTGATPSVPAAPACHLSDTQLHLIELLDKYGSEAVAKGLGAMGRNRP